MDVKDLIEVAKDPAKYEAILANIEAQKASLQSLSQQILEQAHADADAMKEKAKQKAETTISAAVAKANAIEAEAKAAKQKADELVSTIGYQLDAVMQREAVVTAKEKELDERDQATKQAYDNARAEEAEFTKKHAEVSAKLDKLRNL